MATKNMDDQEFVMRMVVSLNPSWAYFAEYQQPMERRWEWHP